MNAAGLLTFPAQVYAKLKLTGLLAIALCASLAANALQHYSAAAAAADCAAAANRVTADIAAAHAAAAAARADQVSTLSLLLAADESEHAAALAVIDTRIRAAARSYRAAQHAAPATCRASADRVRAVNAARGIAPEEPAP